jgi:hypothetical protein
MSVESEILALLRPGETVIWQGTPVPGFHHRGMTLFMMVFGVPFLLIGVASFYFGVLEFPKSETLNDAWLAALTVAFGLPFGAFGALFVFGPLVEARSNARNVRYTLTTRAAYVLRKGRSPSLKVYPILHSSTLELEPGRRASTVWLHALLDRDSEGDLGVTKAGFENIAVGEKVFRMIRELQETAAV